MSINETEFEVNPEVREKFEAKYGKGSTFGYRGRKGFADEQEYKKLAPEERKKLDEEINTQIIDEHNKNQSTFEKVLNYVPLVGPAKYNIDRLGNEELREATPMKDILMNQYKLVQDAAIVGATAGLGIGAASAKAAGGTAAKLGISQAELDANMAAQGITKATALDSTSALTSLMAKKIIGIKISTIAQAGAGALIAQDFITNWAAVDNIKSQLNILARDMSSDLGSSSPAERMKMIERIEEMKKLTQIANDKINVSAVVNPTVWPFAKYWKATTRTADMSIEYYANQIQNYNPYADDWSLESKALKNQNNKY